MRVLDSIDSLALKFADSGGEDGDALIDLCIAIEPILKRAAEKKSFETGIDPVLFEEAYQDCVWRAAGDYNGSSPFTAWLRLRMSNATKDIIRRARAEKRRAFEEISMDEQAHGELTFHEVIPGGQPVEDSIREKEIKKMLVDFSKSNERYGLIIRMLEFGCTNQEIAESIGASRYDAKTRKAVQRAKESFKVYWNSYAS